MVRALIDYENNAEEFWETLQATLPEIWNKFVDSDTVELSCEEWSAVQNVPGFSTGPAYAQAALLVEQESSSTISGGPHTEGIHLETQTMPTLDTFWAIATPTTLASLIADIGQADHTREDVAQLRQLCVDELEANVGDDEAKTLLNAAGVKR